MHSYLLSGFGKKMSEEFGISQKPSPALPQSILLGLKSYT